jgi:serine/threonine protein phosphatase 1
MWQKLMQLQFSPDPSSILLWMLGRGLSPTLQDYGLSPHDGIVAAREGVMSLTRWTSEVRSTVRRQPGNEVFYSQLRRAAYTDEDSEYPLLFVHAGIDPRKGLRDQGDNFWWAGKNFSSITEPYLPYKRIIRGFDPDHRGISVNCVTATIDGGCGFGGNLVAACFSPEGEIENLIEA